MLGIKLPGLSEATTEFLLPQNKENSQQCVIMTKRNL